MRKCRLWVSPYFSSCLTLVFFVLFRLFVRWQVVLQLHFCGMLLPGFPSNQHVVFFCNPHLAFPPCISLASMWCIHTIVPDKASLEEIPLYFIRYFSFARHVNSFPLLIYTYVNKIFSRWDITAHAYDWSTNFRSGPLIAEMVPSGFKHMKSVLFAFP